MQGITLIEDDYGAVNRIISKQLGTYANNSGKKVCFLEPPESNSANNVAGGYPDNGFEIPQEALENSGGAQKNTVVYRTEERYLPLEELKFDIIIFDSFSTYVFGMSEKEVVDLMDEILRLARQGKSFVLTSESPMLTDRVNAYIRSAADTIIKVREEIGQNKINRWLYIPKIMGGKPLDRIMKITIEDNGVDIDTREFVG
jgi:KaiC/GvpD/RAD55 family RecA-like ATPase